MTKLHVKDLGELREGTVFFLHARGMTAGEIIVCVMYMGRIIPDNIRGNGGCVYGRLV